MLIVLLERHVQRVEKDHLIVDRDGEGKRKECLIHTR